MTNERLMILLGNAIGLLEERVCDNYETEVMDALGMTNDEYREIIGYENI